MKREMQQVLAMVGMATLRKESERDMEEAGRERKGFWRQKMMF